MTADDDGHSAQRSIEGERRRQHLRWAGVALGLLALLSVFTEGFFLYAAMVVAMLLGLATATAWISLLGLEVERHLDATEIELGEAVDAHLVVRNKKDLPAPWLFWRDQIEAGLDVEGASAGFRNLSSREIHELAYRLHSTRRGLFRVGPVVVAASGPFGLVRRFRVDREASFVTVLPPSVALDRGWPLGHRPIHENPRRRSLFEDPTRFLGIRDYRHGDELRRIHWRATARSGKLQVKLFEPSVLSGALVAVEMSSDAYPGHDPLDELADPRVELVVTAAASIVDFVLAGDQRAALLANGNDAAERYGDWTGGSFRRLEDALEEADARRRITISRPLEVEAGKGGRQRERLRTALARLVPAPGPSLGEVLSIELPRLPRSLVLMVVTPEVDEVLAAALLALRRSGLELAVVWAGATEADGGAVAAVPEGVPVYAIGGEEDLASLAGQRL